MMQVKHFNDGNHVIEAHNLNFCYGDIRAVKESAVFFEMRQITLLIGPSGCGNNAILRALNRLNDLEAPSPLEKEVLFQGSSIYVSGIDRVQVRRCAGMVLDKLNSFPKCMCADVAQGAKIDGRAGDKDVFAQQSLPQAALWDEVRDKLSRKWLNGRHIHQAQNRIGPAAYHGSVRLVLKGS